MQGLYDTFRRRFRVKGILTIETGLHIGGTSDSLDPTSVDNAVIRLPDGQPYIPGSSMKGILRSFLARLHESGGPWLASKGVAASDCLHQPAGVERAKTLKEQFKDNPEGLAQAIWDELCPVCRLFGSQQFAGRLLIADLLPEPRSAIRVERRHGVAIDVDTRTARDTAKYDLELVAPGARFQFELTLENPSDEQVKDTRLLVRALEAGEILMGAKTGSGLGRVKLVEVTETDYGPQQLIDAVWQPAAAGSVARGALEKAIGDLGEQVTWQEAYTALRKAFGGGPGV